MNAVIKFFNSVKLAIVLIIIITVASLLGTLIPQDRAPQEYAARYGQLASLFMRLQLTHLYHSFWYAALLFLLGVNITVCTLTRLSPKLRRTFRPEVKSEAKALQSWKLHERLKRPGPTDAAAGRVAQVLRARHYKLREVTAGPQTHILARKRTLGGFGSDVVHVGLLVILAGGIVSSFAGFRTHLQLREGQVLEVPRAEFELRLDKFETELYPNGSVRDWKSTLTVLEGSRTVLTKVIEVNHPLSYDGIVFYQSSYGWDWSVPSLELWVTRPGDPGFLQKHRLRLGEKATIAENVSLSLTRFVPDFMIDESRQVTSRSAEPNNPAAFVEILKAEDKLFEGWVFANYPDFSGMHGAPGADYAVALKDVQAPQYSVIEAARDPGAAFIWVGSILLMAGLALAFYWPSREIRAVLEPSHGKTEIVLGGLAAKAREAFETEFKTITSSLRSSP